MYFLPILVKLRLQHAEFMIFSLDSPPVLLNHFLSSLRRLLAIPRKGETDERPKGRYARGVPARFGWFGIRATSRRLA
jgi:hypothetical protein